MKQKRWEYGQVFVRRPEIFGGLPKTGLNLEKINRAGDEGWELVNTIPFTVANGEVTGAFFIFKRETLEGQKDLGESCGP
ncbi:DUF4177 domain-containing protein [Candidatus Poribacteria bacterium]|nr:DUF4177 domain-containing protein [Candidatus Poribacteria bacterium]